MITLGNWKFEKVGKRYWRVYDCRYGVHRRTFRCKKYDNGIVTWNKPTFIPNYVHDFAARNLTVG